MYQQTKNNEAIVVALIDNDEDVEIMIRELSDDASHIFSFRYNNLFFC